MENRRNFLLLICVLSVVGLSRSEADETKGHGFGEDYDWVNLEEGLKIAKESNKPLMMIIHKSWCGACKALKPTFAKSEIIKELSSNFVMVNAGDDDEPKGDVYQPDGGYIPRILFFDSEGELMKNIINEDGNPDYKYYYSGDSGIAASMKRVLKGPEEDNNNNNNEAGEGEQQVGSESDAGSKSEL